jgi:hypothetical protein
MDRSTEPTPSAAPPRCRSPGSRVFTTWVVTKGADGAGSPNPALGCGGIRWPPRAMAGVRTPLRCRSRTPAHRSGITCPQCDPPGRGPHRQAAFSADHRPPYTWAMVVGAMPGPAESPRNANSARPTVGNSLGMAYVIWPLICSASGIEIALSMWNCVPPTWAASVQSRFGKHQCWQGSSGATGPRR